jgi:plasmid stability protein
MPDVTIPDVPEEDLDAVTARARRHGRTCEEEIRQLIHDAACEQLLVSRLEEAARAVEQLSGGGQDVRTGRTRRRYGRVDPTPKRPRRPA